MSVQADQQELTPARRHRQIALGLLRALATTVVLVALYYLLPLNHFNVPLVLVGGLVTLVAVILVQLRVITKARYPTLRAIQALAITLPLFLVLFATVYFTMARTDPASFNTHPLARTDGLYFTVTVFSTVGFGDITAVSQGARLWSPRRCCLTCWPWAWWCGHSWEPCNSPGSRPLPPLVRTVRPGRPGSRAPCSDRRTGPV